MYNKHFIHIDKELMEWKTMEKREKRETKPNKREAATRQAERQSIIRSRNCQRNSKIHENNNNDGHQKRSNDAVESFK
jgi:hypothetical protein